MLMDGDRPMRQAKESEAVGWVEEHRAREPFSDLDL